jgi:dUTP pyrophosphatase
MINTIQVMLDEGAEMPYKAHDTDAGYDLISPVNATVPARGSKFINTGVHMLLRQGEAGLIVSRSGLNKNFSITSTGLIDAGYVGPIGIKLFNHSDEPYEVKKGDKISQIVIFDVKSPRLVQVTEFTEKTERGDNGFGSSGR